MEPEIFSREVFALLFGIAAKVEGLQLRIGSVSAHHYLDYGATAVSSPKPKT